METIAMYQVCRCAKVETIIKCDIYIVIKCDIYIVIKCDIYCH